MSCFVTVIHFLFLIKEGNQNQDFKERTYGALDMGGASTQITFVPTKPAHKQKKIFLFGKEYHPYTHSFLCYGLIEAQRRFFAQLLKVKVSFWPKVCAYILLISYLIILPTEFGENVQNELSLIRVKLEDKLKEPLVFSVKASCVQ